MVQVDWGSHTRGDFSKNYTQFEHASSNIRHTRLRQKQYKEYQF